MLIPRRSVRLLVAAAAVASFIEPVVGNECYLDAPGCDPGSLFVGSNFQDISSCVDAIAGFSANPARTSCTGSYLDISTGTCTDIPSPASGCGPMVAITPGPTPPSFTPGPTPPSFTPGPTSVVSTGARAPYTDNGPEDAALTTELPLGQCEGDCDNNSQCQEGMYCHSNVEIGRGVLDDLCFGTPTGGGYDYCAAPKATICGIFNAIHESPVNHLPLGLCEGDCNGNNDCQGELICYHDPSGPVPGCSGRLVTGFDYCGCPAGGCTEPYNCPPPVPFTDFGAENALLTAAELPLGQCQGDCDNNSQCQEGMYCHSNVEIGRGVLDDLCFGTPTGGGYDYCAAPKPTTCGIFNAIHESPVFHLPLGRCEADCNSNSDCAPGLVCYMNPTGPVPGCSGTLVPQFDYCGCPAEGCPNEFLCPGEAPPTVPPTEPPVAAPPPPPGPYKYQVSRSAPAQAGGTLTVEGFVTIDTLGTLIETNFVDWELVFSSENYETTVLNPSNSEIYWPPLEPINMVATESEIVIPTPNNVFGIGDNVPYNNHYVVAWEFRGPLAAYEIIHHRPSLVYDEMPLTKWQARNSGVTSIILPRILPTDSLVMLPAFDVTIGGDISLSDLEMQLEQYLLYALMGIYPDLTSIDVSLFLNGGIVRRLGAVAQSHRKLNEQTFTVEATLIFSSTQSDPPEVINDSLTAAIQDTDALTSSLQQVAPTVVVVSVTPGRFASMEGEPHIHTWGGNWFDYQGECDLVLLNVPEFVRRKSLLVHVRTTIRYDYSFIEAMALKIGPDVLEVGSFGEWAFNGVDGGNLVGKEMYGCPVYHRQVNKKKHVFDVVVGQAENITITTFKDIVSVKFSGSYRHYGNSTGIMGRYNGTMMARDGDTVMSLEEEEGANAFGQEWQVREDEPMLFRSARAPQAPQEKCRLPSADAAMKKSRRLGEALISQEEARAACAHYTGDRKKACVFDVLAIGDIDIARS